MFPKMKKKIDDMVPQNIVIDQNLIKMRSLRCRMCFLLMCVR